MGVSEPIEQKPPLVLLFEEPSVLEVLDLELLENRGVRVERFSTGRQALALAADRAPRLCLTPMELPDMQARELAARLGELFGPEHVSVVLLLRAGTAEDGPVDPQWFAGSILVPADGKQMQVLMDRFVGVRLRRAERFPMRVRVYADEYPGTTLDLSTSGVKIRIDTAPKMGALVELKFALPGTVEPMVATGRVVRVDTRTWAPEASVAVQFESCGPDTTRKLEDYIFSLVEGRTFQWRVREQELGDLPPADPKTEAQKVKEGQRQSPGDHDQTPAAYQQPQPEQRAMVVVLSGSVRRAEDLQDLAAELSGPLRLDLARLRKIESGCLDDWRAWLARLAGQFGSVSVDRIHLDLARQAASDPRVLSGHSVSSIMLPYVCEECLATESRPVAVSAGLPAPTTPCPQCGGTMVADEELPNLARPP